MIGSGAALKIRFSPIAVYAARFDNWQRESLVIRCIFLQYADMAT